MVLAFSENHWTEAGQKRLDSSKMLLYSRHEEANAPHNQTVALTLLKKSQEVLIRYESHGFNIIKASFKTKK